MGLNQVGLNELIRDMGILSEMAQIVKVKCEIREGGFPRVSRYPVSIVMKAIGPSGDYEIDLFVPRRFATSSIFPPGKMPTTDIYVILFESSKPYSEIAIKTVASSRGGEERFQFFNLQKDKIIFFDLERELHPNQREAVKED